MTDLETRLLTFEETHPRNDRMKMAAIRTEFGISWVRYVQLLLRLVERRDVVEAFPIVCHRIARTRDRGLHQRRSAA